MHPKLVTAIRGAGLIAVVLISLYGAAARPDWTLAILFGVLPLVAFLWLIISGFFGYGAARRSDWVGLVPFCVALGVREIFTLHSVQEIEIQFAQGPIGRHSVVYPLLQMFFLPLVRDPQWFTMHMNGVFGAVACLSLYLFVRHRFASRTAAFLCALFLAVHPLVARFSPTDGPYALCLATWFSGLALLSVRPLDARSMFSGSALLGIAATTRMEGSIYLIASLLILDPRGLIDGVRRHRGVAGCACLVVAVQIAVQMAVLLRFHLAGGTPLSALIPSSELLFYVAVWPAPYNDHVFMWLVLLGAASGVLRTHRLGLVAYLAMLVVLAPLAESVWSTVALHRLIPACAVQTIVAGIGAYSLTAWLPATNRWRLVAVVPGVLAALYIFVEHRSDLTRPYVFTEEYDLVRRHLAPGGVPAADCTLMTLSAIVPQDIDIHDFGQVVPGVRILDCRRADCVAALSRGGCFYYVRSAAAYFHPAGVPASCAAVGASLACLNEPSASFEKSVELQPVDLRTIDLLHTFPDRWQNYPARAEVGLFRVRSKAAP